MGGGGGGLESEFSVHIWSEASALVSTKLNNNVNKLRALTHYLQYNTCPRVGGSVHNLV